MLPDGEDCRQEKGYDDVKGLTGSSWFNQDMCHEYSKCQFDEDSEMFKCKCKEGYEGDGHDCQIQKGRLETMILGRLRNILS